MGNDISQIPSAIRNTMSHLTSRHMEVGQWQAHISQRISQVDLEIAAVEQVKDVVEGCLQDKHLYSQLLSDCVEMGSTLSSACLRQDQAITELKKEEQLTKESTDLLQNQISVLLGNLSSLKEIRAQLQDDLQDKGNAMKLLNRCITCEVSTSCSQLPAAHYKLNHASHDKSHSKNLKLKADNLLLDSMSFRGILQFSLAKIKNSQEHQRRSTEYSLRRKIHQLNKVKEMLTWEKHWIIKEIADLTKHVQKLESQIRNCECKLHQTTHRLDILSLRRDLCLGQPHISLTQQKQDLANLLAGLRSMLSCSQQEVERTHRRLASLEDKLVKKAQHLEVTQSCQNLHQSSLPAFNRAVVLANKPMFPPVKGGTQTYLQ
ncbi:tektin-B1-like [Nematolebias whitei]|uniref:tektin-B1-like n=1 Tax=Nematolebias whitei TaxID=451745 RepID=UPI001897B044|nr:tektin-B1-like [Nematolebias whitei]